MHEHVAVPLMTLPALGSQRVVHRAGSSPLTGLREVAHQTLGHLVRRSGGQQYARPPEQSMAMLA